MIETLEGHYGFKRHVRDSFGTAVAFREDEDREGGGGGGESQERKIQVDSFNDQDKSTVLVVSLFSDNHILD